MVKYWGERHVRIDDGEVIERVLRHLGLWLALRSLGEGGQIRGQVFAFYLPRDNLHRLHLLTDLSLLGHIGRRNPLPRKERVLEVCATF